MNPAYGHLWRAKTIYGHNKQTRKIKHQRTNNRLQHLSYCGNDELFPVLTQSDSEYTVAPVCPTRSTALLLNLQHCQSDVRLRKIGKAVLPKSSK